MNLSEFKIENISDETKNKIKLLSAYSLPNNPSERGMTPEQIKKRFYDPILSSAASALGEIDRVILEANRILAELVQRADGAAETANDAKLNAEGAESAAEKAEENAKQAEAEAAESKTAAEDAVANALAAKEAAEAAETAVLGLEVFGRNRRGRLVCFCTGRTGGRKDRDKAYHPQRRSRGSRCSG